MNEVWAKLIFDACTEASREGKTSTRPRSPPPRRLPVPENHPRTIAAAQATVDFYEALRGHPEIWTEIDYAEAEASLKAADAWDADNYVLRVTVDESLRDRLRDAIHKGDLGASETSSEAILRAVLAALAAPATAHLSE